MGYLADQPIVWPFAPNWASPVVESLAWLTDVMQASDGAQQVRQLRSAPRRSFSCQGLVLGDARRVADAIRFDLGVQRFRLPIYPDVQRLSAAHATAATHIACRTTGFDFVTGGEALLWRDETHWERVTIDSIDATGLALTSATSNGWPGGTALYPLRKARLQDVPQASQQSDEASTVQVQCLIDEPCDWSAAWPSDATYRSLPVLEWRGDESQDPTDEYDRQGNTVDASVGPIYYMDLPGVPFRAQSQAFVLYGRTEQTAFRSLLYQLAGRASELWVPSWQNDLKLTQSIGASDIEITVAWNGYTLFGREQVNRRDIRIELFDDTVFYRRITSSVASGETEVLQLDSALGQSVDASHVRQINWLSVCALAGDTVSLSHTTDADGIATATLNWQAVKNDV